MPIRSVRSGFSTAAGRARRSALNRQMRTAAEFRDIIIKSSSGNFVRLSDVAEVEDSVRNCAVDRLVQQAAGGADPDHQAGRRQRHRYRRSGQGADPGTQAMDSRRRRDFDPDRPHRDHPRQRRGYAAHAAGDRRAGDGRGVRVPAPDHADHRRRRVGAAGAGRNLCRDVAGRILDRQSVADGAGDLGRLRGRRRHRHDREHVPQSRARHARPIRRRSRAPGRSASRCCRSACRWSQPSRR